MDANQDDLTHLVKNPSVIFLAMLRRLKLPHNEIARRGVMIPGWLKEAIETYYKSEGFGQLRLDEFLLKMYCHDGIYQANKSQ